MDNGFKLNANSKLVTHITFVPAFSNFSDFLLTHETAFEIPLAASKWKLKLGVANNYNSQPPLGFKKLDTTYFTRIALNWGP